ncbi:hypothetical protein RJ639_047055 [Escallonia herrerae]|uniref:Polyprotein n=1 Tax=Escallonia herrerae TaxID=1293975 RepID=A0AA89B0B4_9ASTE|nr:hypothetical protein RJ639_047055 [Escallonia herrerae]
MGYFYHMCPDRDWFATYRSFDGGKVLMGSDIACKVVGIGPIQIRMNDGFVRTLTDVSHGSIVTEAVATASSSDIDSDTTKLSHMRLRHMSERGLDVLSKQGLLGSKKIGKLYFCEHCVFGKQCRVKSSLAVHTTKGSEVDTSIPERYYKYLFSLHRGSDANGRVVGYVDSDYVGDLDRRRSLTGYVFTFSSYVISWKATLQTILALSTIKAEYIVATKAVKEGIWLKGLVSDLGLKQESSTVYCDSQSAIYLTKNLMFHERTKHIDVRFPFIRDVVSQGTVIVEKIFTDENSDDKTYFIDQV